MPRNKNPRCWQCDAKTKKLFEDVPYYLCEVCDCSLTFPPSEAGVQDIVASPAYTDPLFMKEMDYIDHAVVHAPSPA